MDNLDEKNRLRDACASAMHTIDDLDRHMGEFIGAFSEDKECWRGEAASEEQCFVSSDKEYLAELMRDMKALIEGEKEREESGTEE